jgi:type 1 fimbriae regulatory protein FimE
MIQGSPQLHLRERTIEMAGATKGVAVSNRAIDPAAQCAKPFLTPDELIRVLRVARAHRTRDWCMILVAYRHGLRAKEVCTLRLADVRNGSLSVQRLKGSKKTVQPLDSHPSEPLLDEVAALRQWLLERSKTSSDFLFISVRGGAVHLPQFFRTFQAIAKEAGVQSHKRQPRILKYSLAAHLLARKVDIALIGRVLGHVSLNSTLQYVKTTHQQEAPTVQRAIRETF